MNNNYNPNNDYNDGYNNNNQNYNPNMNMNNQMNRETSIYDDNFVESYMDAPKEKKDKTKTFIILLVIILAVIAGILLVTNVLNNQGSSNNEEQNNNQNEESLSLNDETVKNLYEMIDKVQQRGICTGSTYYFESNEVKASSYNNDKKYEQAFVLIDMEDVKITNQSDMYIYEISDETIDNAMKKFFGPRVTYKKEGDHLLVPIEITNDSSINLLFIYDEGKKMYIGSLLKGTKCEPNLSATEYPLSSIYTKLTEAVKKDDTIVLTQKYIITDNHTKLYSDPKKENLITTITPKTTEEDAKKLNISQHMSKAGTITYTFKLNSDDNYYFESSKLVN